MLIGSKRPQFAVDLGEPVLLVVVRAGAVLLDALLPVGQRRGVLPAILERRGQLVDRLFAVPRLRLGGDLLIDLDVVELVGQFEPLDAGRQLGDRLVFLERVQGVGAALVLLRVVVIDRQAEEAPDRSRTSASYSTPNWLLAELGQLPAHLVQEGRVVLDRLLEGPAPRSPSVLASSQLFDASERPACLRHRPARRSTRGSTG